LVIVAVGRQPGHTGVGNGAVADEEELAGLIEHVDIEVDISALDPLGRIGSSHRRSCSAS